MNRKLTASCIDINTPYCPCLLADTNHCLFCSHLKGQPLCDCNWSGVCILYEKHWKTRGPGGEARQAVTRTETESKISLSEEVAAGIHQIEFAVAEELARELVKPGSFVFLRRREDQPYFHFPAGVMKVSGSKVRVIIEAAGPKSSRFVEPGTGEITVRGPYYNGILGQPWIDNITCGKILLVAGGMGQPPAVPIAARLTANGNEVVALLAPGRIGKLLVEEDLRSLGVAVHTVDSLRRSGLDMLIRWFGGDEGRYDLVVSAGPDGQHYAIIDAMETAGVNLPMAATNNATMCCGEGICGSCEIGRAHV